MFERRSIAYAVVIYGVLASGVWGREAEAKEAALLVLPRGGRAESSRPVLKRALETRLHFDVLTDEEVVSRIDAVARPVPPLDAGARAALARESEELLRAVAYGEDGESIEKGRGVLSRESARISRTSRDGDAAMHLGDICFYVVRALLHQDDAEGAREQVRQCLRLVPDAAPSGDKHPPSVRALASEVRSEPTAQLAVSAGSEEREACTLRVQGRELARLPAVVDLLPGSYAAEVDCGGGQGRLHVTTLTAGTRVRLRVNPKLERALGPGTSPAPGSRNADFGAAELAGLSEWLLVDELWTIEDAPGGVRVGRTWKEHDKSTRRSLTVTREPASSYAARLDRAVAALACTGTPCEGSENRRRAYSPSAFTIAGAGVSVTALVGSWIAYGEYAHFDSQVADPRLDGAAGQHAISQRNTFSTVAWVTAATGSAGLAATAPFLLPPERGVPWWAWLTGVAGLGLSGAGTVLWARNGKAPSVCPELGGCERYDYTVPLAPMLVFQGASLLSVPITYLVRKAGADDTTSIDVGATPGGALVTVTQRSLAF